MKVVTIDGKERVTVNWDEFWEVAKNENSEKRVVLKDEDMPNVYIDVYRNNVYAKFRTNWFRYYVLYRDVRPLIQIVDLLNRNVESWNEIHMIKYVDAYDLETRHIYSVHVYYAKDVCPDCDEMKIELLTYKFPDRELLAKLINEAIEPIKRYLYTW